MPAPSPRFRRVLDQFAPYKPGRRVANADGQLHSSSPRTSPRSGRCPRSRRPSRRPRRGQLLPGQRRRPALTEAIARRYGVPPAHIALGCGSVGVAQQLLAAAAEPGTEVLYAWRSFEAYPILVPLTGATDVRVPLRDETHDLAAMAAAITPPDPGDLRVQPEQPDRHGRPPGELAEFLGQVPPDCLVVLDEAYADYVRDPGVPNGIDLYRDHPNLAVLRTFSKAHGLAGLRVGSSSGRNRSPARCAPPCCRSRVNSLAQTAAIASLAAEAELHERVDLAVKERARVRDELLGPGLDGAADRGQLRLAPARRATPRTSPPRARTPGSASGRSGTRARASRWGRRRRTTRSSPSPGPIPGGTRPGLAGRAGRAQPGRLPSFSVTSR